MSASAESPQEPKAQPLPTPVDLESMMNLSLLDPPRWGWTAVGGVQDVLPPHERARRKGTRNAYKKQRRKISKEAAEHRDSIGSAMALPLNSTLSNRSSNSLQTDEPKIPPSSTGADPTPLEKVRSQHVGSGEMMQVATGQVHATPSNTITNLQCGKQTDTTVENSRNDGIEATDGDTQSTMKPPLKTENVVEEVVTTGISNHIAGTWVERIKAVDKSMEIMDILKSTGTKKDEAATKEEGILLKVHSVKNGELDMYMYHRGREGMEMRNPDSGELLCDMEPTDTNHDWDAPKLTATVLIEFPLEDDDTQKQEQGDTARYREIVSWDLSDSTSPTPLQFATNIAQDFGLTFGQTMDLAMSIQQQLDTHMLQNCTYNAPLAVKDPSGNERRIISQPVCTYRFGAVLEAEQGGMRMTRKEISHRQQSAFHRQQKIHPSTSRQTSTVSVVTSVAAPRRKSTDSNQSMMFVDEEKVEEKYRLEVQKRAKETFLEEHKEDLLIPLETKPNYHCHICHKRCNTCALFNCGNHSHAYCQNHCNVRLGLCIKKDPLFSFCPICCLSCLCSKCNRKLEAVSKYFKGKCEEQGKEPEEAVVDDVLARCAGGAAIPARPLKRKTEVVEIKEEAAFESKAPKRRKSTGRSDGRSRPMVPKPPLSDFPREVCGMREIEPGTAKDYMTIYTADGNYVCENYGDYSPNYEKTTNDKSAGAAAAEPEVVEDGNVDYCHVCQKHGNLLCCDFCPRAYHLECMAGESQPSETKWECHVCKKEKAGLENDHVNGSKSMDLICASFVNCTVEKDVNDKESLENIRLLSIIHALVVELIEYDFGYMFREPVDLDQVSGYSDLVKNPMDLGTIGKKLINGGYADKLQSRQSWDDVIVAVLKDIELVWHNCFTFNYEGSAIYRMAHVHRRRSQNIQKRSFDNLLSENVKIELAEYVRSCVKERGEFPSDSLDARSSLQSVRPKSKHKITVKVAKGGPTRPVAILDPVSGRVVKVYSALKSANQAALSLLGLGHRCEWPNLSDVKSIVHRSASDPSLLLFGYRWLILDDLRNEKVKFSNISSIIVEMSQKGSSYLFLSVDEALSFAELPTDVALEEFRKELSSLRRGDDWVTIGGRSWRRPRPLEEYGDENNKQDQDRGSNSPEKISDSSEPLHPRRISDNSASLNNSYFLQQSVVAKEDLVTGRRLIGFENLEAAYQDWLVTCECSPAFPWDETTSVENFQSFYLDGERNVDGIVWRTLNGFSMQQQSSSGALSQNASDSNRTAAPSASDIGAIPSAVNQTGGEQPGKTPESQSKLGYKTSLPAMVNSSFIVNKCRHTDDPGETTNSLEGQSFTMAS